MADPEHLNILKQGVERWNEWREQHPEIIPDLSDTVLDFESLGHSDLSRANLRRSSFVQVDFRGANLSGSDLSGANLSESLLGETDLSGARIFHVNFDRADLFGADFSGAELGCASFGGNDLSQVKGLNTVTHRDRSHLGTDTISNSGGNIPEGFLRGCGVSEDFIIYARSLTTDYYSCFISHSSKDQEFADRLHLDLQATGVKVWLASHDMSIGARIRPTIDELIRVYDKLLLVLSENSVSSQWVEQEVETALAKEREQEGRTVLLPVRIDDTAMEVKSGWPALLKNTRNVGDFTRWKDPGSYRKAFDRLLRDLKAEEKKA